MIRTADDFGAPVTDPGGNVATTSGQPTSGRSSPRTVDTRCTSPGCSSRASSAGTSTVPVADPAEVVADEVDDHHVLRLVLGQQPVRRHRRPLDGSGLDRGAVAAEEQLRRRGDDRDAEVGEDRSPAYGAGLPAASAAASLAGRRRAGRAQRTRQMFAWYTVACRDRRPDVVDGADVRRLVELLRHPAFQGGPAGTGRGFRGVPPRARPPPCAPR